MGRFAKPIYTGLNPVFESMFCRIRNRECSSAGEITVHGCLDLGEKEGEYKYTICYREGGRLSCF